MHKMRVLFCSPFLNFPGHIRRFTLLKSISMAKAGLDVTVFGYPLLFDEIESDEYLRYVSLQARFPAFLQNILARCSRWFGSLWLFIVEVGWTQWAALRYARKHAVDIVYIADIEPWLLLPMLWLTKWFCPKVRVVGFMSFFFNVTSSMQHQPWFSRLRSRLNYRAALRLPHWMDIVSDCKYTVEPYVRVRADRTHAIMEGYEPREILPGAQKLARRQLNIPEGEKVLLHFGLATPGKGTELLVAALQNVPPVFELYIVGQNLIYSREGLLDNLSPEWRAHVHHVSRYVSEEERIAYFAACEAVVLPYRSGFLGAGGNFRDAISFGKAILVSDQFLMGEMVRQYDLGLLFKPEDVDDLRRALREFAGKPDDWFRGITERSKAVVEEYSWDRIGVRYRELFAQLLSHGGQRSPYNKE